MLVKQRRFPVRHILTIGLLPSFLKVIVYRLKGYEVGNDVSIGFGSVVIGQKVRIGKGTKIGFLDWATLPTIPSPIRFTICRSSLFFIPWAMPKMRSLPFSFNIKMEPRLAPKRATVFFKEISN